MSKNPYATYRDREQRKSTSKHQFFVHDLDLFATDETPSIPLLHKLCSNSGYSYEWDNDETPQLAHNGKSITCIMDNSVLLVVPRLSSYSSSRLSSTSRPTDQSNYSRKLELLSDPVTTRSDKHACGKPMLTDPDNQATGNREPADEMKIQRKAILFGYSPSQFI